MERKKDHIDYGLEVAKGMIDIPWAILIAGNCLTYGVSRILGGFADGKNHFGERDIYDAEYFEGIREHGAFIKEMYNFLVYGYFDKNDKEGTSLRGFYDDFVSLWKNEGLESQINSTLTSKES